MGEDVQVHMSTKVPKVLREYVDQAAKSRATTRAQIVREALELYQALLEAGMVAVFDTRVRGKKK